MGYSLCVKIEYELGSVAQRLSGEDNGQAEGQSPEVESRKTELRLRRQMQAGFSSGAVFMLK